MFREFQPTRPHRARPGLINLGDWVQVFQPTRPHRARQWITRRTEVWVEFQPTRPHRARLAELPEDGLGTQVSTHAPAQGATWLRMTRLGLWGCFNPRARTGRDNSPPTCRDSM